MDEFCQGLDAMTAGLARMIHDAVQQGDKAVTMSFGAYNNAKDALRYREAGVTKYALTKTVRGLSFHSMVMYSNDETLRFARARLTGVRLQKGCFTIIAPEAFDLPGFRAFIDCNASQNFQPVIERYTRRARRKTTATHQEKDMGAPVIRFDIGCRDQAKTVAFYEKVFDWTPKKAPFNTEMETGGGKGIDGAITALGHEPHNYVMIYLEVADVRAACEAIRDSGGEVTVGPVEIPGEAPGGGGKFAWFKDPEGNQLAIFEPPATA